MKKISAIFLLLSGFILLAGCSNKQSIKSDSSESSIIQSKKTKVNKEVKKEKKQVENHGQKRIPISKWIKQDMPVSFPILMYHDINVGNTLQMPVDQLRNQFRWLKEAGYYFLTPEEALVVLEEDKIPQEKIVWVTFDDGYKSMINPGIEIFKELAAPVTINVIAGKLQSQYAISVDEIKQLDQLKGTRINIESHTLSHVDLNQWPMNKQKPEMDNSKKILEKILNKEVIEVTYPAGHYNADSVTAAREAGYKLGLTTTPGLANKNQGVLELHRVRVNPGLDQQSYLNLLKIGY